MARHLTALTPRARRYLAVLALASDAAGTPEGDAAERRAAALRAAFTDADRAALTAYGAAGAPVAPPASYAVGVPLAAALARLEGRTVKVRIDPETGEGVPDGDPAGIVVWAAALARLVRWADARRGKGTGEGGLAAVGLALARIAAGIDPDPPADPDAPWPLPDHEDSSGDEDGDEDGRPWTRADEDGAEAVDRAAWHTRYGWTGVLRWAISGDVSYLGYPYSAEEGDYRKLSTAVDASEVSDG